MVPPDAAHVPDTWRLGEGGERARVLVLGCGGAGCNTLRPLVAPPNAERVALNDAPHPSMLGVPRRILLEEESLQHIASMEEKIIPTMATDAEKALADVILERDFVIAIGGLGGGFGGWSMGVAGRVARILGRGSLALATLPFTAEGMVRRQAAAAQIAILRRRVDGLVAFGNDDLLRAFPTLPLTKAFAVLGAIMARPASSLSAVLTRTDLVPLKRMLGRAREWRFGMGAGTEKHRCFLAVEEAYHSPWFTGRHEDVRHAILLLREPPGEASQEELVREIRLRSPLADVAWAVLPEPTEGDRVEVQILAGLDVRL